MRPLIAPARFYDGSLMEPKKSLIAVFGPLLYLLIAAALAALLAYPVFVLSGSGDISLYRTLVSRGGQALLIVGVYPLMKWLGLSWETFGWSRRFPGQWLTGFALGITMLGLLVLALVGMEVRAFVWPGLTPLELFALLGKVLVVGFGVALLEESIFRGALLGIVWHLSGPVRAVLVSSLLFAALHFIGTKWSTDLALIGWDTGFRMALDGFSHLPLAPPDAFLGLFVAGLMLGSLRILIPASLGLCMGLHAGWVFIIKLAKALTLLNPQSPYLYLVSGYDYFVGYLSSAWLMVLLLMFLAVVFHIRPRGSVSHRR